MLDVTVEKPDVRQRHFDVGAGTVREVPREVSIWFCDFCPHRRDEWGGGGREKKGSECPPSVQHEYIIPY
jgi:hypothetical protein